MDSLSFIFRVAVYKTDKYTTADRTQNTKKVIRRRENYVQFLPNAASTPHKQLWSYALLIAQVRGNDAV